MAKVAIHSPNPAFKGDVAGVTFEAGVGEYDPKQNPAAARYFERHGYGTKSDAAKAGDEPAAPAPLTTLEKEASPEGTDARDFGEPIAIGTKLRDAAVDPEPEDFLAPVNAGKEDPHGPDVVAPEIHHAGPKGLKPGDVHVDKPDEQERDEKELAAAVLIEGEEHPAIAVDEEPDRGPLGLSDPGSVDMGIEAAKAAVAEGTAIPKPKPPRKAPAPKRTTKAASTKKGG